MADRVGFEPTSLLRDYLISSQGRYDHFDTCPCARKCKHNSRGGANRPPEAPGGRCSVQITVSMRITLVLPLWPLVLPPVMTTTSPGLRCSTSFAARSA